MNLSTLTLPKCNKTSWLNITWMIECNPGLTMNRGLLCLGRLSKVKRCWMALVCCIIAMGHICKEGYLEMVFINKDLKSKRTIWDSFSNSTSRTRKKAWRYFYTLPMMTKLMIWCHIHLIASTSRRILLNSTACLMQSTKQRTYPSSTDSLLAK